MQFPHALFITGLNLLTVEVSRVHRSAMLSGDFLNHAGSKAKQIDSDTSLKARAKPIKCEKS
jgi:hypothetical protein